MYDEIEQSTYASHHQWRAACNHRRFLKKLVAKRPRITKVNFYNECIDIFNETWLLVDLFDFFKSDEIYLQVGDTFSVIPEDLEHFIATICYPKKFVIQSVLKGTLTITNVETIVFNSEKFTAYQCKVSDGGEKIKHRFFYIIDVNQWSADDSRNHAPEFHMYDPRVKDPKMTKCIASNLSHYKVDLR
jgi:hypothetical protein